MGHIVTVVVDVNNLKIRKEASEVTEGKSSRMSWSTLNNLDLGDGGRC